MKNKIFTIALIIDTENVFQWQSSIIQKIIDNKYNIIKYVILRKSKIDNLKFILNRFNRMIVIFMSKIPILRSNIGRFKDRLIKRNIKNILMDKEPTYSDIENYKLLNEIREVREVDIIVNFTNLESFDLSMYCNYGIFNYQFGSDFKDYLSCGHLESLRNINITSYELKFSSKYINETKTVYREYICTHILPVCNTNNLFSSAEDILTDQFEVLRKLGLEEYIKSMKVDNSVTEKLIPKDYGDSKALYLHLKCYLKFIMKAYTSKFYYNQWFLFLINCSKDSKFSDLNKGIVIASKKDRYWADPSIVVQGDYIYLFVEEDMKMNNKGHITVLKINYNGEILESNPIIVKEYHMSYPYIFSYNNSFYMIPECSQSNAIRLYRASCFPYKWEEISTIMDNIAAIDTSIIYFNGMWWLFFSKYSSDNSQNGLLYLYYSDKLLKGNWIAHPQNPISSDVRGARNAGRIFEHRGNLYRPAQNCSINYGYGIKLKKITKLSEVEYSEEDTRQINGDMFMGLKGIHTINEDKGIIVADMLRRVSKLNKERDFGIKFRINNQEAIQNLININIWI